MNLTKVTGKVINGFIEKKTVTSLSNIRSQEKNDATKIKRKKDEDDLTHIDELDEWLQPKQLMKPENQLVLTEAELKEEFTRILTANNPHAPDNIIRFNFKEKQYKPIANVEQIVFHFSMEGNLIHKDSEEAQKQSLSDDKHSIHEENDETHEDSIAVGNAFTKPSVQKVTNQFNFCERGSQTFNNPSRERGTETEPPPRGNYSSNVNQWEIYDAYVEDLKRQEKEKEKEVKKSAKRESETKKKNLTTEVTNDEVANVSKVAKIIERMVNQNTFDEIAYDFKYWEDASDEYRENEGTVLPLWKFSYKGTKKMTVTALSWSPNYEDLFAVGYGSYDFLKQSTGIVCFYSLKNPTYPERIFMTDWGVMCLDIHHSYSNLVAVGFYDGSIAVYNLESKEDKPILMTSTEFGKHTDPVWEVRWQTDDLDGNLNLYSVSSDGRVVLWTIIKSELQNTEIIQLWVGSNFGDGFQESDKKVLGCGTCFDFHKTVDHLFLVGTEEGKIQKCSKAYSSHYLSTFNAHQMAVYAVRWNYFHSKIFMSCSADWSVKIWDHTCCDAIFTYNLGSPVGDVAWAPFSATVFAAVTADGKVVIFDLNVNKYKPICEQKIVQKGKTKLTHVSFNKVHPIVIIGDDRGCVTSVKLSPNLRKAIKERSKGPENEIAKFDKLLSLAHDPFENVESNS
ncbi:dynein intermediate chain 2, ciliary isoform X1 [Hydra vulgaris]|uniref:dynein intermediate chain 2, ciliary isoform X1 n=1 Tax=Hydra vulgaris TaxID=6087 RepID=UPI000641040F|nr:dynein intermediate chain 2, ciliary [Hydra vulgaris]XP_047139606.1 dynein intermediate chain 2, ciliary [Hydra vulgaris]XP_047139607.1 dynein intermediate chain 2, ciliary [Hydra vulgaris]